MAKTLDTRSDPHASYFVGDSFWGFSVWAHNADCVPDDLLKAAQDAYPNKAGHSDLHHVTPKYLGGADDGQKVMLDAAYHQHITNAFRKAYPYGHSKPDPAMLEQLKQDVYPHYPIQMGTSID